jgi:hypothetical protein
MMQPDRATVMIDVIRPLPAGSFSRPVVTVVIHACATQGVDFADPFAQIELW